MKAKACTECRQHKLRCLYPAGGIGSCQRCAQKDIACVFDPKYHRVNRRKRRNGTNGATNSIDDSGGNAANLFPVTNGGGVAVNGIVTGNSIQHGREGSSSSSGSSTINPLFGLAATVLRTAGPLNPSLRQFPLVGGEVGGSPVIIPNETPEELRVIPCVEVKHIEGDDGTSISIPPEEITKLFSIFLKSHLYYFPLDLSLDCEAVYSSCPLLFWTICAIAGRELVFLSQIQKKVNRILKDTVIIEAVRSIEVIQALLLLASWPFPYRTQLEDQSFSWATLATQFSLRLGLHRPSLAYEFSSKSEILKVGSYKRLSTWMACYIVCNRECLRHGVPNIIVADFTLISSFDDLRMPLRLRTLCRLAYESSVMNYTLGSSGDNFSGLMSPSSRLELVKQYMGKLDSLTDSEPFLTNREPFLEFVLVATKLQVLSYILTEDVLQWSTEALELVNRASLDSSKLIRLASTSLDLDFAPSLVFRYVIFASLVLLKVLRESRSITLDRASILSDLTITNQILDRLYCKNRNDEHILLTKGLLQIFSTVPNTKLSRPIKSRGPANLLYDAVFLAKEWQQQQHEQYQQQYNQQLQQQQQQQQDRLQQPLPQQQRPPPQPPPQEQQLHEPQQQEQRQGDQQESIAPVEFDDAWLTELFSLVYYM